MKWFGRKKSAPVPVPAPAKPSIPEQSSVADVVSDCAATYRAIQDKIAQNPLSSLYRVPVQETEVTVKDVDLLHFSRKSGGSFVALDLETTGLDCVSDAIVEIGIVKVADGQIVDRYQQYVNPNRPIPAAASSVNHITDDMVADQPFIYEVLPDVLHFIGENIMVIHNARFDVKFLCQACMRYRFRCPKFYFESMTLKTVWPDVPDKKLQSFLNAAGIENAKAHSAIGDAEALARLMIVSLQKDFYVKPPADCAPGYSNDHFTGTVDVIDDKLSKLRFVLTGQMPGFERVDFEKMILSHGGKCTQKISSATDFLVVGSFPDFSENFISSKVVYARKLIDEGGKIRIITPDDVLQMVNK